MKKFLLLNLCMLVFTMEMLSQVSCPCCNNILQSPVVTKPVVTEAVASTCSTLVVKWKGARDQTCLVRAWSRDQGGQQTELTFIKIIPDVDFTYTAIIAAVPGTTVSWSIQAQGVINDRAFYSYPLRSDREYAIANCENPVAPVETHAVKNSGLAPSQELTITNEKLAMYPNPVNDLLYVRWGSEYKGAARITIINASGAAVKVIDIRKEQADYNGRVPVSSLTPGLYFLSVRMKNGEAHTMKFFKR